MGKAQEAFPPKLWHVSQGSIPQPFPLPCPIPAFRPGRAIPAPPLSQPLTLPVASLFPGVLSWQVACSPSIRSIFLSWECTTQDWMSGEGKIWSFHSRYVPVTQLHSCQPGGVLGLGQGLPGDRSMLDPHLPGQLSSCSSLALLKARARVGSCLHQCLCLPGLDVRRRDRDCPLLQSGAHFQE